MKTPDIRLIAADMDGTLLDSAKRMPAGMFERIRALHARGIRFVAASGRQYYDLLRNFPGMEDDMLFLAENGAMVVGERSVLYLSELPYEQLAEPVRLVRTLPDAHPILCGAESAYYEGDVPILRENAQMYYARLQHVPDVLEAAKHDHICKIAVFRHRTIEDEVYPALKRFEGAFQVVLSGDSWVDLMLPGVNKGSAMRQLQQRFGLTPDQCMAFGDYLNDRELMQSVTHSYGMANGHPDLLAVSRYRAPSNDESGVARVLDELFFSHPAD